MHLLALLAPLLVFGLVVFVHELGHFLAAKAVGVYAPRFSIGFGKALWKRRVGETEYVVAILPLGGYVRMASREDETMARIEGGAETPPRHEGQHPGVLAEVAGEVVGETPADWDPEAMYPFGPKPVPEHRWFESKSLAARLFIMLAGVTMNFLLAYLVWIALLLAYGRTTIATRVVGGVRPGTTANAAAIPLAFGDTISAVNGAAVRHWGQIAERIATADAPVRVTTQRGEVVLPEAGEAGGDRRRALVRRIEFYVPPVIDSVVAGFPAAKGGLAAGDSIVAINGTPIGSFADLARLVGAQPLQPVTITRVRAGVTASITVRPDSLVEKDSVTGASRTVGRIGVVPRTPIGHENVPLGTALVDAGGETWRMVTMVGDVVRRLVSRDVSVRQLGGPIAIARTSVAAAREGAESLLFLLAFLSVNIAVLNLLPIPVLDGGQVLMNIAEAVKGSPFSGRTREYILRVGLVAIGLLFVTVMWNDVTRLIADIFR